MNRLFDFDAAIFDLDGTLLDSMYVWGQIDREFFARRGLELPSDYVRHISGLSFIDTARYTKAYLNMPESVEEICAEWMRMAAEEYALRVPLKRGAREYLNLLSQCGIPMAIATSNARQLFEPCLKRLGIWDMFSACITTDETGERDKSSGTIFRIAADRLGACPDRCCVFEDMPEGITGAKNAGMRVYCVMDAVSAHAHDRVAEIADRMVESFEELTDDLRCVIFTAHLNGDAASAYAPEPRDFVMCADAGWQIADRMGVKFDLTIGDFDSAPAPDVGFVDRHPVMKDDTDTMLCIRRALDMGLNRIVLIGGMGGRMDHTLANIQAMKFIADRGGRAELRDGDIRMYAVSSGEIDVPRAAGKLSVFALSDVCEGVTIRGAKYQLTDARITNGFPIGMGNDFTDACAHITVRTGALLIMSELTAQD